MSTDAPDGPILAGALGQRPVRRSWLGLSAPDNRFEGLPPEVYQAPVSRISPFRPVFLVADPAGIKQVLLDKVDNYPKTPIERAVFNALFGEGLLSSEGETWRVHRRTMAPAFDPRSVATYLPSIAEETQAFARRWAQLPAGAEVDVSAAMTGLAFEIIARTMFSTDAGQIAGVLGDALHHGQETAFDFKIFDVLPVIGPIRMRKRMQVISELFAPMDGMVRRLIDERQAGAGGAPADLLGRLVAAMDEETGARMSAKEVRDEVVTIFIAGHETTAAAMTFVWYMLSEHPAVEARLHAELAAVLGGRAPVWDDLPELAYARQVVDETMRLYPPAPGVMTRVALKADEICGVRIPKGAFVLVAPWVTHRHRALWDDPERFDPDRFSPARSVGRQRYAFIPFGAGPRVCIGAAFAQAEAVLTLATLAQKFSLKLKSGHEVALRHRVTLRPKDSLPMTLERRAG
jgi:cytochrome P450